MGLFDSLLDIANTVASNSSNDNSHGAIEGGKQKKDGSHDHRTNTGGDRTPAQKAGDKQRRDSDEN